MAMIYEFALDPELVAKWHDPREFAFFREAFGPETGRIPSAFPREWREEVMRAFQIAFPSAGPDSQAYRRLDALLGVVQERMVKRSGAVAAKPTWLEKAEAEHAARPFRGILSLENPRKQSAVMSVDSLYSDSVPSQWIIPPNPTTRRNAVDLVEAVTPLLRISRYAVIVDPYFHPKRSSFCNVLKLMLQVLWGGASAVVTEEVDICLDAEKVKEGLPYFGDLCRKSLPSIIPSGRSVRVILLQQRYGGEKLHNRYLLTELGGVSLGLGLQEALEREHGETDDLCRLSADQHLKRWRQYRDGTAFTIAADPIVVRSLSCA